ncbi:unnamed protein product [Blepharisma stoltei]|uniref:Uncharacterized protein n=1 Tax=Blepharisma stoltei TaxID=1481888 RepID=A0AAU9IVE8_9CILI|nr:unnamed protein product [Blepharisma stoltei]
MSHENISYKNAIRIVNSKKNTEKITPIIPKSIWLASVLSNSSTKLKLKIEYFNTVRKINTIGIKLTVEIIFAIFLKNNTTTFGGFFSR